MGLFKWLIGLASLNSKSTVVIPDYLKEQKHAPYYCGTAFCGHNTKRAAALCWQKHCIACDALQADLEKALKVGGNDAYIALYNQRIASVFPKEDPTNWPINRSSIDMQNEYLNRVAQESSHA